MKLHVSGRVSYFFDLDLLSRRLKLVSRADKDSFVLDIYDPRRANHVRSIVIHMEPPVGPINLKVYKQAPKCHTAFLFGVTEPTGRVVPITSDPLAYPYVSGIQPAVIRPDARLGGRVVYYAGGRGMKSWTRKNDTGAVSLYALRDEIVAALGAKHPVAAYGHGWPVCTRRRGNYSTNKVAEAQAAGADFVLACENTMFPNYVSEKLLDALHLDRVVLYLGESSVASRLPFVVDLNAMWHPEGFDHAALLACVAGMTPEEYARRLGAQREWLAGASLDKRFDEQRRANTRIVLARLGVDWEEP